MHSRASGQGPAAAVDIADTRMSALRRLALSPSLALAVVIIAFVLFGATQTDQFANPLTWINILRTATITGIVAVFATMVFVSGGLDLSVGSVLAAGAMMSAFLAQAGLPVIVVVLVGILVGSFVGLLNGILINYALVPAIVVTLGTLFAVRSVVSASTRGNPIGPLPPDFVAIGQGSIFGIPYLIIYAIAVTLIAFVILHLTNFGWSLRATGGNPAAARSAGINVKRVSVIVYILSGSAAALAGVLTSARLGSGSPTLGQGFELAVIAAAIIGGTSIAGAIGTVPGALLGALLLSVLATGLVLLKVDPVLQNLVTGVVLVLAAGLDQLRRRQMFQTSARVAKAMR